MSEHRFTDETATIAALNVLVNDMHHALGRIIAAYQLIACVVLVSALLHALAREWVAMAVALAGCAALVWAVVNTRRRRRKYHPRRDQP